MNELDNRNAMKMREKLIQNYRKETNQTIRNIDPNAEDEIESLDGDMNYPISEDEAETREAGLQEKLQAGTKLFGVAGRFTIQAIETNLKTRSVKVPQGFDLHKALKNYIRSCNEKVIQQDVDKFDAWFENKPYLQVCEKRWFFIENF